MFVPTLEFAVCACLGPLPYLHWCGVKDYGVWRRLCHCFDNVPFGGLKAMFDHRSEWSLPVNHFPPHQPIYGNSVNSSNGLKKVVNKIPKSWQDYYNLRGIPYTSPVCAILTFPLTIFYILSELCSGTREKLLSGEAIVIHYLGCEQELDMLPAFWELVYLLPGANIHMTMYGASMVPELSGLWVYLSFTFENHRAKDDAAGQIQDSEPLKLRSCFRHQANCETDQAGKSSFDTESYSSECSTPLAIFFKSKMVENTSRPTIR